MNAPPMSTPRVTVLMAVYNGERYLHEAVDSILQQTFADFEFVIVDDGSTDSTLQILSMYSRHDSRIVLICNEKNIGLTRSLNKGLAIARGEYIARMDADDISLTNRFAQQVAFLEQHTEVAVVGTAVHYMNEQSHVSNQISIHLGSPGLLRWQLCFENPLRHPTVMMRRQIVNQVGGYNVDIPLSQDKDLWQRISAIADLANLAQVLLYRRQHLHSVSYQRANLQRRCSINNSQRMISMLLGREIAIGLVERIVTDQVATPAENYAIAGILYQLAQICSAHPSLTGREKERICHETSRRILRRCLAFKFHWRSWLQFYYVFQLDKQQMKSMVEKACRRRIQGYFQLSQQKKLF
jgi:glycosyltransferase involved in cell wall biosynthesis